jgi:hypothetical protein
LVFSKRNCGNIFAEVARATLIKHALIFTGSHNLNENVGISCR